MRIVFLGKDKPCVLEALTYLFDVGHDVVQVCGPESRNPHGLLSHATQLELPTCLAPDLYTQLPQDVDVVISYLFWRRIQRPLIQLGHLGCINFHPAPLPDFRGVGGYNMAILENLPQWGASAHYVDETFDTGNLIEVERFDIAPTQETAWSLEKRTQMVMLNLFKRVISQLAQGTPLPSLPQGAGRTITKAQFEALRQITEADAPEMIERKIRAFWYPPYGGAAIQLHGQEYTLVSDTLLQQLAAECVR